MQEPALKKSLGTWDGIALLIGITIGSGIYSTPYLIAGHFPDFASAAIAWVGVGAFVLVSGLVYAELGTRLPATGGEYVYIEKAYGKWAGFMFGWAQLFIIRTSPAAGLAIIATDYIGFFVDDMVGMKHTLTAMGLLVVLGVFNVAGVRWASLVNKTSTIVKVTGLIIFAVGGLYLLQHAFVRFDEVAPTSTGLSPTGNLIAALFLIIFSHTGWDRVGYVAGEMKDPRRSLPRTMLIGLTLILLIYWAVNAVYYGVLGVEGLRATTTPAATVMGQLVGHRGAAVIAILAIVSAVGSINGTMMAASRVYYAMARDGLFFKWLDHVHPRFRTPSRAVWAHVIWGGVILLVRGNFSTIVAGMVFGVLIFYTLTGFALFKFRRDKVGEETAWRMPGFPWLPGIYLAAMVILLVARVIFEWQASLADFAFIATGIPVSWYWLRKNP
ncbi:MAG: APC family permease [Rhodothermales bacterium]|nr:APC family permease [Rhodothermales bacterium]MBO6781102.1 APC family permease [Rhodothermales bacterium]